MIVSDVSHEKYKEIRFLRLSNGAAPKSFACSRRTTTNHYDGRRWILAVRKEYQPARMRERCGDRFRASEYSIHCQVGGHPRFATAYVLPEHLRPGPFSEEVIFATGWLDLGQHLVAIWRWVEEILQLYDLMNVGLAKSSLDKAKEAVVVWLRDDPCARRLTGAEVAFLAQVSSKDEVSH